MSVRVVEQTTSPSEAIVERVAKADGVDPTDLRPLYEVIDPDALDMFVSTAGSRNTDAQVQFEYQGYHVTVTADGVVHLAVAPSDPS